MAPSPAAVAPLPARGSGDAEAGPLSAKLTRSLTHSPTVTKRNHIAIHSLDVEEVGWRRLPVLPRVALRGHLPRRGPGD